eukprot:scpid43417/ scgid15053/ Protein ST7 homolog
MGSSLMMSTLNFTRDMPLTEKEIDTLHKIAASKSDEEDMPRGGSASGPGSPGSTTAGGGKRGGGPGATVSAGVVAGGGVDPLDPASLDDLSLGEMFLWSAVNLWGVWLLTCVLTMWTLRDYLPIRESLQQYFFALQMLSIEDVVFTSFLLASTLFIPVCCDWYCHRVYDISFFSYIRSGDILSFKLPEKRDTTDVLSDYKVWRNPLCLFRGSEYDRYTWVTNDQPLTSRDRELTAQDHSVMFICASDMDDPESPDALMNLAWQSCCSTSRIQLAHEALDKDPSHPAALLLLAEEEAATILETDGLLRQALKSLETSNRPINPSPAVIVGSTQSIASRNKLLLVYIKWRLGMCSRKLGNLKDAVRLFRQVTRDCPYLSAHENLIEALLEMKNYADVQQVLSKYDDLGLPKSASICYTSVLLRARSAGELPLVSVDMNRGGATNVELELVASISRAVEFNPHVSQYLLEQKSFILPPEHVVKRGDSEAVAYAFHHLRHWKHVESALIVLHYSWETAIAHLYQPTREGRYFHPYPASTKDGDMQILPAHHAVSSHPFKRTPLSVRLSVSACLLSLVSGLILQAFPQTVKAVCLLLFQCLEMPLQTASDLMQIYFPSVWFTLSEG